MAEIAAESSPSTVLPPAAGPPPKKSRWMSTWLAFDDEREPEPEPQAQEACESSSNEEPEPSSMNLALMKLINPMRHLHLAVAANGTAGRSVVRYI